MKTIDELELTNGRVFIRCDFNVPLTEDGKILDDTRIRAHLPTIQYALKKKAAVILASHLGRPKGKREEKYSLAPVANRLMELLDLPELVFSEDCVGAGITKLSKDLRPGQVLLLENLRFHAEEEANGAGFAEQLASLCDIYINDAFGAMHRAHASITGMIPFVKQKGIGLLIKKELEYLTPLVGDPKRPLLAILGGAKVSDKIGVIEALLGKVDALCIGGAMAYTFLRAKEIFVGNSKVETDKIHLAKKLLERALGRGVAIFLPVDHIIAKEPTPTAETKTTMDAKIPEGWSGFDIGPKTTALFIEQLQRAKTVFWNGPLGFYEIEKFSEGTYSLARAMGTLKAQTIIGGGDSAAAIEKAGVADKISHISTGGGASLEFIEHGTLPGLEVLDFSPTPKGL